MPRETNSPVSVVIPCWRCADVIGRAVASVSAQTEPPREIILVDDASGDGTLEKLQELASKAPHRNIRAVSLARNQGPGIARNAGWDIAQGDYVAFLDADDAWHSRKLEIQVKWMLQHPEVDVCGHASRLLRADEVEPSLAASTGTTAVSLFDVLIKNPILTRTVMLKRSLPMRFADRSILEDHLLWIEILAGKKTCVVLDQPLAFCFRPEFSPDSYSGNLWVTERRELNALLVAYRKKLLPLSTLIVAAGWALLKYGRRVGIQKSRIIESYWRGSSL